MTPVCALIWIIAAQGIFGLTGSCAWARDANGGPVVVVSIKPIHSLVASIMMGIGEPLLIIHGSESPHEFSLRPSDAENVERAQLVFWIGPMFESFLSKPLGALAGKADVVTLSKAPGVETYPIHTESNWESDTSDPNELVRELSVDGHLWLDPHNARAIAAVTALHLAKIDPEHAASYARNEAELERKLTVLDSDLEEELAPARGQPFIVFHDAFQYFSRRYGLAEIGSITLSPDQSPSPRHLAILRQRIGASDTRCVFVEPDSSPTLAAVLITGAAVHTAVLDPEGITLQPGPNLYGLLMTGLAEALTKCLLQPARRY